MHAANTYLLRWDAPPPCRFDVIAIDGAQPEWLQNVAGIFPLNWTAQGMRPVFRPDSFAALEQTGEWELGLVAIITLTWLVLGLIATRLTFHGIRKDS